MFYSNYLCHQSTRNELEKQTAALGVCALICTGKRGSGGLDDKFGGGNVISETPAASVVISLMLQNTTLLLQHPKFLTASAWRRRIIQECLHIMSKRRMFEGGNWPPHHSLVWSCHITEDESLITFASFLLSAVDRHPGDEISEKNIGRWEKKKTFVHV